MSLLDAATIERAFVELNDRLAAHEQRADISVVGGAVRGPVGRSPLRAGEALADQNAASARGDVR